MGYRLLCLDIGATLAWAYGTRGELTPANVECGFEVFEGDRAKRAGETARWLTRKLETHPPDMIGFERPFARGEHATRSLWGLAGVIEAVAYCGGLGTLDMPSVTICAHHKISIPKGLPKGKRSDAKKAATVAWAEGLGYNLWAFEAAADVADAIALLHYIDDKIVIG